MELKGLRGWLLTTAVSILILVGGCYGTRLSNNVEALQKENTDRKVENATLKQSVDDFRHDFDNFKADIKDDLARHHQGNRQ